MYTGSGDIRPNPRVTEISEDAQYTHKILRGRHFTFIINKLLDLHYSLLTPGSSLELPNIAENVNFYESLFRSDLDFGLISDKVRYPIVASKDSAELEAKIHKLFASIAEQFAKHLQNAYLEYLTGIWLSRAPLLEATLAHCETAFLPYEDVLFNAVVRSLSYAFEGRIPICLVTEGTVYGAFTSEPALSIINVQRTPPEYVAEVIIHEATHGAEEYNSARHESALAVLKRELTRLDKESLFAEAWHCLIFWNSGELIRRHVNPSHIHYGTHFGIYDRFSRRASDLLARYWNEYLDGKLEMVQALTTIAERL